jgi:hypothetical protein
VRLCGLYLPNGNPAPGPKYDYKLAWMERLQARAALLAEEEAGGDGGRLQRHSRRPRTPRPEAWRDDALFLPETRAAFRRILNLGFTEAIRARDASGRGITPSGITRPAPGKTTASASTIAADPAGRRPDAGRQGSTATCAAAGKAVGPCAGLDRTGGLIPPPYFWKDEGDPLALAMDDGARQAGRKVLHSREALGWRRQRMSS